MFFRIRSPYGFSVTERRYRQTKRTQALYEYAVRVRLAPLRSKIKNSHARGQGNQAQSGEGRGVGGLILVLPLPLALIGWAGMGQLTLGESSRASGGRHGSAS